VRGLFAFLLFLAHLFQPLRRAKTVIRVAALHQFPGVLLVNLLALRLPVRAVGAANVRAFVPLQAQPAQPGHQFFFRAGDKTFAIGVFNAQNKLSAGLVRQQIIV